jgi:hypothetical protein
VKSDAFWKKKDIHVPSGSKTNEIENTTDRAETMQQQQQQQDCREFNPLASH